MNPDCPLCKGTGYVLCKVRGNEPTPIICWCPPPKQENP
jgi:hypothetical protein